ncbi:hypothetical protein ABZV92_18575 [Streptomyces rubiginosohelvolus]|uniref:hypothetical protein n=1 Tax=Streptomyces rubiginosohelvolus TaxID=67362 RepID=UPI00339F6434
MPQIDISGLGKNQVLAALYNNARIQGKGIRHPSGSSPLSAEQAREITGETSSLDFDYLDGRVLKVDLSGDRLDPRLYDRDNGENKAARVIEHLRATGSVEEII